jgi:DNA modification methylase
MEPSIAKFQLKKIRPAQYNPRVISTEALKGLTASLQKFGCVEPIVVNVRGGKNVIVGGHQRHKALMNMHGGDYLCQCVTVDLAEKNEKVLNLTLNNPKAQGEFIEELGKYIDELRRSMPETDFLDLQIEELRASLPEPEEKIGKIRDDDVPETPKTTTTKLGDVWLLDEHRLMCGDSTKGKDVTRLMNGKKADLFATDPPYCVDYTGKDRPGGGHDWTGVYHEIDIPDATAFIKSFYETGLKFVKPNAALYLWHAAKRIAEIHKVANELKLLIHQWIIWVKPCVVLSFTVFNWRHEPCLLMWQQGSRPPYRSKDKTLGSVWPVGYVKSGDPNSPEYYTDVWELDWDGKKRPIGFNHPTSKPVEVFAIPMRIHTRPGEICYEPFCGSGSQIIAAEKLGRRCYAMELEPFFCDVTIKRWEEWSGKKAKRIREKK